MAGEFLWDVVGPGRPPRTPGVAMAGFADRGRNPPGLRLIPHPAVTVALMFGPAELVMADAAGRERRGSLVAGIGWQGAVGMRHAAGMRCVQVRLAPTVARGILGVGPKELGGELVSPDDLWGREVAELAEGHGPARVSADCGYADQSHLHRDVVAFTGTTPATVAGEPFLAVDDVAWPGHL
jgi:hypothetical protein